MHYAPDLLRASKKMYYGDEYDEDQEFLPEVNVFDRVEYESGETMEQIAMQAGVIPEDRKKGSRFTNNVWRFYVYVNAAARRMMDEGIITNIKYNKVPSILKTIQFIENPEYKNPDVYVLGYATVVADSIDKKVFESLIPKLPPHIKPTDILRYARLIIHSTIPTQVHMSP